MRYMLLIYGAEELMSSHNEEEMGKVMAAYNSYTEELQGSGKMLGGEALQPTANATTIRVRDGKTVVTDGPFAETKEQLGGYYAVEADNLDEAMEWAAKIPGALSGSIEVRPIVDFE